MDGDLIVIGSGFGGAVCAMRAARAGLRVILLERGDRMSPRAFDDLARGRRRLFHRSGGDGLVDLPRVEGLTVLGASALGGGSQVYTSVTIPAPPDIYDEHWPRALGAQSLRPCFERVAGVIAPTPTPVALPRTLALESLAPRVGGTAVRLPLAIDWPDDPVRLRAPPRPRPLRGTVVSALAGGPVCRKRTLDRTYLAEALAAGADVRLRHEVTCISTTPGGYGVHARRAGRGGEILVSAPRVVLAAGTVSTVRLLLECRDVHGTLPNLSPALGRRFFTNGDFGALLLWPCKRGGRTDVEMPGACGPVLAYDSGPPVTAWLDLWKSDRLYLMETGPLPPLPFVRHLAGDNGIWAWSIGVMGFDDVPAALRLVRRGVLKMERPPKSAPLRREHQRDGAFHDRVVARLRELAAAAGARLLIAPRAVALRRPVTLHPLGGAALADSLEDGVVDARGEVFNYAGLYVADGSLLPTPVGAAPSMTIAALAEHVVEQLLRTC